MDYGFTVSCQDLASLKMKEIEASLASMGVKAKVETKEVVESFNIMGERMTETFKNLKSLLLTGLGITALFEGWEFIENSKEAFEGLEKQVARLDTVLKSTKFAAGFSSDDIQNQAKEVSKGIVNSRQEILQAQATLLANTNVRGDTFKRAFESIADYSTFFGTDLASGARILGRALQDPLQGMNQLKRASIVLTPIQKEQIKNYEQQGQLVKAQAILLDEIDKRFGGQAKAYALTDAGKIQVARKQWEELEFKLGEIISRVEVSLIPAFSSAIKVIKDTFNSSTIQFFIQHIKDLVELALKLIPIWVIYRAVMLSGTIITAGMVLAQKLLALSVGNTTIAVDGAIVSLEGFKTALVSTGIGALIVGVGLLVEKFISMNSEISETVDKLSNIKEITDQFKQSQESAEKVNVAYSNLKNLNAAQKSALATDIANQIKDIQDKIATSVAPQLPITEKKSNQFEKGAKGFEWSLLDPASIAAKYGLTQESNGLKEALKGTKDALGGYTKTLADLQAKQAQLKKAGISPLAYSNPGAGTRADAINTSNLSGASGGLGSAKIIKIYFQGPFQQNVGVKESKAESEKAIEKLTEMISGFSQSVNSQ